MNLENINSAISEHILLLWWTDENQAKIKSDYGEEVLAEIKDICSFASNGIEWSQSDDLSAYYKTMDRLIGQYPFLKEDAIIKITNMTAYFWK